MENIIAVLISIISLTLMEIVLGIDNIVFISILTGDLEDKMRAKARYIGLSLAMIVRIVLLSLATVLIGLSQPYDILGLFEFSLRDAIMFIGGTFLLYSSVKEIHHKTKEIQEHQKKRLAFHKVIMNIILIDIVFSFDSILTAIGLVQSLWIMIAAVILSMVVMIIFSGNISNFIEQNPTVKMLALSFLLMIGFILILEAFHVEIPKGYIYYAMFFSLFVVLLNIKTEKHAVKLQSIVTHDKIFKIYAKNFFNPESDIYKKVLSKTYEEDSEQLTNDIIEYLCGSQSNYALYLLSRYSTSEIVDAFSYAISEHQTILNADNVIKS